MIRSHSLSRRGSPLTLLLLSLTACLHGALPKSFPPAQGPDGATVTYQLRSSDKKWEGEVYAVDSAGFLIRNRQEIRGHNLIFQDLRLVRIGWESIRRLDMHNLPFPFDVGMSEKPTAERVQRIALVTRFPQGVSAELLANILASLGLDRVEELR
jgi:hypothetical protein